MLDGELSDEIDFKLIIKNICDLPWQHMDEDSSVTVAWAYYFFSIQFRENLQTACDLFPDDQKLQQLKAEECGTDNLSPWPGVAASGERMDHDEFMRRLLELSPIPLDRRQFFVEQGQRYLDDVRALPPFVRALSIASYEDGGLERVFRAILRSPAFDNPLLHAFRHFLAEHIRFDSDPDQGHGSLSRHMQPDDRIVPLWNAFRAILIDFAPELELVAARPAG